MTSPKRKHVSAITRSIALLKSGLDDALASRFHESIEYDMILLNEVKDILFTIMDNPTLPMFDNIKDEPHDGI